MAPSGSGGFGGNVRSAGTSRWSPPSSPPGTLPFFSEYLASLPPAVHDALEALRVAEWELQVAKRHQFKYEGQEHVKASLDAAAADGTLQSVPGGDLQWYTTETLADVKAHLADARAAVSRLQEALPQLRKAANETAQEAGVELPLSMTSPLPEGRPIGCAHSGASRRARAGGDRWGGGGGALAQALGEHHLHAAVLQAPRQHQGAVRHHTASNNRCCQPLLSAVRRERRISPRGCTTARTATAATGSWARA